MTSFLFIHSWPYNVQDLNSYMISGHIFVFLVNNVWARVSYSQSRRLRRRCVRLLWSSWGGLRGAGSGTGSFQSRSSEPHSSPQRLRSPLLANTMSPVEETWPRSSLLTSTNYRPLMHFDWFPTVYIADLILVEALKLNWTATFWLDSTHMHEYFNIPANIDLFEKWDVL